MINSFLTAYSNPVQASPAAVEVSFVPYTDIVTSMNVALTIRLLELRR